MHAISVAGKLGAGCWVLGAGCWVRPNRPIVCTRFRLRANWVLGAGCWVRPNRTGCSSNAPSAGRGRWILMSGYLSYRYMHLTLSGGFARGTVRDYSQHACAFDPKMIPIPSLNHHKVILESSQDHQIFCFEIMNSTNSKKS